MYRTDVYNINVRFRGLETTSNHKSALFTRHFSYNILYLYNNLIVMFMIKLKELLVLQQVLELNR